MAISGKTPGCLCREGKKGGEKRMKWLGLISAATTAANVDLVSGPINGKMALIMRWPCGSMQHAYLVSKRIVYLFLVYRSTIP